MTPNPKYMHLCTPIKRNFISILLIAFSAASFCQLPCENDTTGLKSLIDLKFGYYLGYQGGLYPNGLNTMPFPHYSAGMNASRKVLPRDEDGNVDWADGKVVMISMGASTAGNAFNHFKTIANANPMVNHCLKIVNCTVGSKGLEIMYDTIEQGWYWDDNIIPDLDDANVTNKQVQVVWIMATSRVDTILYWPFQPRAVADRYETLMGVLVSKFPNLQMVFLSGFPYGDYADPLKEFYGMIKEPSSYWNNWTVKWLIERQINNDPDLKFTEPGRQSAWLGWGPHLWADGLRANATDGLLWNCMVDFKPDGGGYHLSDIGKEKEGNILFDYFFTSPLSATWFRQNPRWVSCDSALRSAPDFETSEINIFPNPANHEFNFEFVKAPVENADIEIINYLGESVYRKHISLNPDYYIDEINVSQLNSGLYHLIVQSGEQVWERSLLVQH